MERRTFLGACAALSSAALAAASARADAPPRLYARVRLIDIHGAPVRATAIARNTNYVFQYPYAATPCFLLRLDAPIRPAESLRQRDGTRYAWHGGVGPDRALVAFSAICAHKLAYPTREVSFIRYQRERSATSSGHVIHCCADHSVYDPAEGARVVAGPAPQPLAAIVLEHDAARDELYALGTQGAEQFDPFFTQYALKLVLEYGSTAKARARVEDTSVVSELSSYCRNTIQC
jgi:arsenite oxidase small subunit